MWHSSLQAIGDCKLLVYKLGARSGLARESLGASEYSALIKIWSEKHMGRKKSNSLSVPVGKILPSELCGKLENLVKSQMNPLEIQDLSPGDKALNTKQAEKWAILCLWIAYKRYPFIDIGRSPYNNPSFQIWKRLAFTWNAQLNLAQNTFDAARQYPNLFKKVEKYGVPLNYWFSCMEEYRKLPAEKVLKEQTLAQFKKHLAAIKKRQLIEPSEPPTPINDTLFNMSIKLVHQHNEVGIALDEYCHWLSEFLTKDCKKFSIHWIEDGKLMSRTQGHPQPFSVLHPNTLEALQDKSTYLSTITYEPWNEQPVYVPETSEIFD